MCLDFVPFRQFRRHQGQYDSHGLSREGSVDYMLLILFVLN